jgi:aspartyl protease
LTSNSPVLDVFSVTVATIKSNSLSIPISINCARKNETVETLGLIDSGAGGQFIDQNHAKTIGLVTQALDEPITAQNVDGTEIKRGKITTFIDLNLTINKKTTKTRLLVTGLGKQRIILGFPWLNEQNPNIDWKTRKITWRTHTGLERLLKGLIRHPKHQGKPLGLL